LNLNLKLAFSVNSAILLPNKKTNIFTVLLNI
jgi:hypothetical protein